MPKKRTQIFKAKDTPREYVKMFNNLVKTSDGQTEGEIVAEMVELYAKHCLGDEAAERSISFYRRPYEHD